MTEERDIANALEMFNARTTFARTLCFKTECGTAVMLELKMTASDSITDKDWEIAQDKFAKLESDAVNVFVS